ncbi:hypothetical protein L1987_19101 [Smallanthus sonchifolius]|uniref:Uncharacterized protein n=1 Tax=Smallanthus sonchifolius TaxID=185202 RepID=A0ACB9J328_9ASTR|nr:hypothetical protein L1987_19101 [Smallanthus sonchifolius]
MWTIGFDLRSPKEKKAERASSGLANDIEESNDSSDEFATFVQSLALLTKKYKIDLANFCLMANNYTFSKSPDDSTSEEFIDLIEKEPRSSRQGLGFTRGSGKCQQTRFVKALESTNIKLKSKDIDSLVIKPEKVEENLVRNLEFFSKSDGSIRILSQDDQGSQLEKTESKKTGQLHQL